MPVEWAGRFDAFVSVEMLEVSLPLFSPFAKPTHSPFTPACRDSTLRDLLQARRLGSKGQERHCRSHLHDIPRSPLHDLPTRRLHASLHVAKLRPPMRHGLDERREQRIKEPVLGPVRREPRSSLPADAERVGSEIRVQRHDGHDGETVSWTSRSCRIRGVQTEMEILVCLCWSGIRKGIHFVSHAHVLQGTADS